MDKDKIDKKDHILDVAERVFSDLGYDGASTRTISGEAGVNMAMLDALELADCLLNKDFPDTHAAIAAFEQQMLARASETAQMTMEQTASFHSPEALDNILAMFNGAENQ